MKLTLDLSFVGKQQGIILPMATSPAASASAASLPAKVAVIVKPHGGFVIQL
jgi:hypothetical protein